MDVVVAPYDQAWPQRFDEEAARLAPAFGPALMTLHHIGSTSVPDLAAKPIIDIMPVVRDIADVTAPVTAALARLGYEGLGEFGLPGRRYFRKGGDNRTHHVHVYAFDHPDVVRHLAFRDYLRARPVVRCQYARLKVALAARYPRDIKTYMDGKDPFIKATEARALAWWRRLPGLLVTGTVGVGKTTTLDSVADLLREAGLPYLAIDLDALCDTNARPPFDPFGLGLVLANLEAVVARGRAMGVRVVVMAGVVERPADIAAVRDAMGGADLYVVRLDAAAAAVEARLRRRMAPGPHLDWHLQRAGELQAILEHGNLGHATVAAGSRSSTAVARDILRLWDPFTALS